MIQLTGYQQAALANASGAAVEDAMGRLGRYLRRDRWLGLNNRYRIDVVKQVSKDASSVGFNSKHLAELVAASAPTHCLDGWSFLGRAFACLCVGDADAARHLAYYAELRAAMALLAASGIGVLNNRHVVIDDKGIAVSVPDRLGTHDMAWLALKYWAAQPDASAVVSNAIRPAGKPIGTWLGNMPGASSWRPLATDWLLAFGLDLGIASTDHDARNVASYRPSGLRDAAVLTADETADFVVALWRLMEPTTYDAFDELDLHMLQRAMSRAWTAGVRHTAFADAVGDAVAKTVGSGPDFGRIHDFLVREHAPDEFRLFEVAIGGDGVTSAHHHTQVMARATLLLRVATGTTRNLLRQADLSLEDTRFWWERIGHVRGIWEDTPEALDSLTDLWVDRADALDEVVDWIERSSDRTHHSLRMDCAKAMSDLGATELFAIWGLR